MNINNQSEKIFSQIQDIYSLAKCLQNSLNYDFCNCNRINFYNLILLKIIDEKLNKLVADYDEFDLLLYNCNFK